MNFKSLFWMFVTWLIIAVGYMFFYFPFKDYVYHGDSYHYLLQAQQGVSGFIPSLIRLVDYNHLYVCFFLLACLFLACWLLFKTFLHSDFLAFIGCLLVFFDPYLYQAIHLGIIDNVHLLIALFVLIFVCLYYFKQLWWLLPVVVGVSMYVWHKPFNFLWNFPSYFNKYWLLKGFYVQELLGLTNTQLLLCTSGFLLFFVLLYIKRKFFYFLLLLIYVSVFCLSLIFRRFYLFLIPLQILVVLLLLYDSGVFKTSLRKAFVVALIVLILAIKINFFILSPPDVNSLIISDLQTLDEGLYVSGWGNGNYIWYYSHVEPVMHHAPDPIKTKLFADAMMVCNQNVSRILLDTVAVYYPSGLSRFLVLFPNDINKLSSWSLISKYELLPCSNFYSYFKSNTTISVTEI